MYFTWGMDVQSTIAFECFMSAFVWNLSWLYFAALEFCLFYNNLTIKYGKNSSLNVFYTKQQRYFSMQDDIYIYIYSSCFQIQFISIALFNGATEYWLRQSHC
jgi:hypothetical protein